MAESAPLRPSILAPLVIWFLVLCASCFIMLGEMVWLMFLLWLPWFVWTRWNSRAAMMVGVLCLAVLIAHSCGHQVIGSPRVAANRPFEPDVHITVLGPGTTMMLSDGRSFRLSGLTEKLTTDGQGALGLSWRIAGRDKKKRVDAQ